MDPTIYSYRLLGDVPLLIVLLAGVWLCWTNSKRCPRACRYTGAALAIVLSIHVVFPLLVTWIFQAFLTGIVRTELRALVDQLIKSIPRALAWAIILWVIFAVPATTQQVADGN